MYYLFSIIFMIHLIIATHADDMIILSTDSESKLMRTGLPNLPVIRKWIKHENQNKIVIKIQKMGRHYKYLMNEFPFYKGLKPKTDYPWRMHSKNIQIYNQDQAYPQHDYEWGPEISIHGQKYILLTLFLKKYYPQENKVQTDLWWKVSLSNAKWTTPKKMYPNKDGLLIVVDQQFKNHPRLAAFKKAKQQQGLKVKDLYTSKLSTIELRALVKREYAQQTSLGYLLLIGHHDVLPAHPGDNHVPRSRWYVAHTDHFYGAIDTNHYESDILGTDLHVGRIPAKNSVQLSKYLNRIQSYSKLSGNEPFLRKASFIARVDDGTNWNEWDEAGHDKVINKVMKPKNYLGVFPHDPTLGGDKLYGVKYSATREDVLARIQNSLGLITYAGHGWHDGWEGPEIRKKDIEALSIVDNFPIILSFACYTGDFARYESFGESWINTDAGAVAFIGASNTSYTIADVDLETFLFNHLLSANPRTSIGQAMTLSFLEIAKNQSAGDRTAYYMELYNLLGDPTLLSKLP